MNNGSTVIKKSNKMTLSYFNSVILGDHLVFICIENFWNLLTNGILMNLCQTSMFKTFFSYLYVCCFM